MAHPTFTQPEALRLAEIVGGNCGAELRRLYAANIDCIDHFNALKAERDELLEALQTMIKHPNTMTAKLVARAALAKASGSATQTGETE